MKNNVEQWRPKAPPLKNIKPRGLFMPLPTITIDGQTVTAPPPTVKMWRKYAKFAEGKHSIYTPEGLNQHIEFICEYFRDQRVTPEKLEDTDLGDLVGVIIDINELLSEIISGKAREILKNAQNPAAAQ